MCNKISAWQVIRSNFTSNIVLYRLILIILDTRTFNSRGPSYIESTSSQHALVLTPLTSNESSIYAPECAEWKRFVLLGCSRNLVKKMETSWQVVSRLPSQTNEGEFPPFLKGTPSSSKKCQTEGHMCLIWSQWSGGFLTPPGPHHSATCWDLMFSYWGDLGHMCHGVDLFITPVTNTLFPMIWLLMRWAHQTWVFHWYVVIWVARCTETAKPQKCGIWFSLGTCLPLFFFTSSKDLCSGYLSRTNNDSALHPYCRWKNSGKLTSWGC